MEGLGLKQVVVLFPVVVEVEEDDTLDTVMDRAADTLQMSSITPIVQDMNQNEIFSDEELHE